MTKSCTKCKQVKPVGEFNKDKSKSDGLHSWCRQCNKDWQRDYKASNKERVQADNRRRARRWRRKTLYGVDDAAFASLVQNCNSCCEICGVKVVDESGDHNTRLVVDHDHSTGKVRGILCESCNTGLGRFNDEPWRLEAAAAYLRKKGESFVGE